MIVVIVVTVVSVMLKSIVWLTLLMTDWLTRSPIELYWTAKKSFDKSWWCYDDCKGKSSLNPIGGHWKWPRKVHCTKYLDFDKEQHKKMKKIFTPVSDYVPSLKTWSYQISIHVFYLFFILQITVNYRKPGWGLGLSNQFLKCSLIFGTAGGLVVITA